MSIGDYLGIAMAGLTVLSLICGGVWWMSALHSDVKAIRIYLANVVGDDKEDKHHIWEKLNSHSEEIAANRNRITVLENRRN